MHADRSSKRSFVHPRLIIAGSATLMRSVLAQFHSQANINPMHRFPAKDSAGSNEQVIDPVCGMTVTKEKAAGSYDYEGRKYFFCNQRCLERFRENPGAYTGLTQPVAHDSNSRDVPPQHAGGVRTEYTCPMHAEIVRDKPGSCPICGMALEPRTISIEEEENPELTDMSRRFWVGVVLTL